MYANNFLKLIAAQKIQGTLYNVGLDAHGFGSHQKNVEVYGHFLQYGGFTPDAGYFYKQIINHLPLNEDEKQKFTETVFSVECLLKKVIDTMVNKCGIRSFKPQSAFYEQFGPTGLFLLSRLCQYLKKVETEIGQPIINLLDCKRGDIATTQAAYFMALLGNLSNAWGIDYSPYGFDIINVTPYMGIRDVLDINPNGYGLSLLKDGKGIIVVDLSSNPDGPSYQKLMTERGYSLHECVARDLYERNLELGLETDGISAIGMVVGSTHQCNGSIRAAFPTATHLVPGFGAQKGAFNLIMPELIKDGKHAGHGGIFSASRASMFSFLLEYGGDGDIRNFEKNMINAISNFRINEKKAYKEAAVNYPF